MSLLHSIPSFLCNESVDYIICCQESQAVFGSLDGVFCGFVELVLPEQVET